MTQKTFTYCVEIPGERVPKIGEEVVLISYEREGSDYVRWGFSFDTEGIGGNLDKNIKRLHGWRGTTGGVAKYAHGLRKVLKVTEYEEDCREFVKITVGKDLAPDAE